MQTYKVFCVMRIKETISQMTRSTYGPICYHWVVG